MKAAGRTLTVGELREALAGVPDTTPLLMGRDGARVVEVEANASEFLLHGADDEAAEGWYDFVLSVAEGDYPNGKEARSEARRLLGMD